MFQNAKLGNVSQKFFVDICVMYCEIPTSNCMRCLILWNMFLRPSPMKVILNIKEILYSKFQKKFQVLPNFEMLFNDHWVPAAIKAAMAAKAFAKTLSRIFQNGQYGNSWKHKKKARKLHRYIRYLETLHTDQLTSYTCWLYQKMRKIWFCWHCWLSCGFYPRKKQIIEKQTSYKGAVPN